MTPGGGGAAAAARPGRSQGKVTCRPTQGTGLRHNLSRARGDVVVAGPEDDQKTMQKRCSSFQHRCEVCRGFSKVFYRMGPKTNTHTKRRRSQRTQGQEGSAGFLPPLSTAKRQTCLETHSSHCNPDSRTLPGAAACRNLVVERRRVRPTRSRVAASHPPPGLCHTNRGPVRPLHGSVQIAPRPRDKRNLPPAGVRASPSSGDAWQTHVAAADSVDIVMLPRGGGPTPTETWQEVITLL